MTDSTPATSTACGCNPAGPGSDNSWPDGPPYYDEDCPVHCRPEVVGQPVARDIHDTNTCPDEDCQACIQGCLGCRRKYVRTINGYCAQCVENEVWRKPVSVDPRELLRLHEPIPSGRFGSGFRLCTAGCTGGWPCPSVSLLDDSLTTASNCDQLRRRLS